MERFPLPSSARYGYADRFNDAHRGTDILAPAGTPVLAVDAGRARASEEPKGGRVVYLDAGGVVYFYGHLSEWSGELAPGKPPVAVRAGDELGKVGNTGNAQGRTPHLHFQMRRGSLVLDPYGELARVDPKATMHFDGASLLKLLALAWVVRRLSR